MAELVQNLYATALFETAQLSKVENAQTVSEELVALKEIFIDNSEYVKLLSSPACSREQKTKLLDDAFSGKLCDYTLNFLKLLVDNGRFASILSIIDEYVRIYDANNGVMQITAVTAVELQADLKEKLVQKLNTATGKTVKLNNVVDKSVIGGIKLRYDNTEIDSTVKSRLDELKQTIKQITL